MAGKALLKSIDCAYLPVRDVAASAAWYERVLGLKLRSPYQPGQRTILLMDSGQWIFLLPCPGGHSINFPTNGWLEDGAPFEMFPISFETDDIRALERSLRGAGAWVEDAVRDHGTCGLQLLFADLDGHKFLAFQQPVASEVEVVAAGVGGAAE